MGSLVDDMELDVPADAVDTENEDLLSKVKKYAKGTQWDNGNGADGSTNRIDDERKSNSGGPGAEGTAGIPGGAGSPVHVHPQMQNDEEEESGQISERPFTPYSDPGKQHLADLVAQQTALNAPAEKPSLKKRILMAGLAAAPTLIARAAGGPAVGAGVAQGTNSFVTNLNAQRQREADQRKGESGRLAQQIETERGAQENREFQDTEQRQRLAQQVLLQKAQTPGTPEAQAYEFAIKQGKTPMQALDEVRRQGKVTPPEKPEPAVEDDRRYRDIIANHAQGHPVTPEDMAWARAYEKQKTLGATAGAAPRQTLADVAVAKLGESMYKEAIAGDWRLGRMREDREAAKSGNQQAMVSLVANHVGMTLGLQPGSRITLAHWKEAMESAPWLDRVQAHFDKDGYLSGVVLTPDQMDQMVELAVSQRQWAWGKARALQQQAREIGLEVPEPQTVNPNGAPAPVPQAAPGAAAPTRNAGGGGAKGENGAADLGPAPAGAAEGKIFKNKQTGERAKVVGGRLIKQP